MLDQPTRQRLYWHLDNVTTRSEQFVYVVALRIQEHEELEQQATAKDIEMELRMQADGISADHVWSSGL